MKWVLLTFADGSHTLRRSSQRLKRQAKKSGFFTNVVVENNRTLKRDHADFWDKHGSFIENNPKGHGFWIWKSEIILQELKRLPPDTGLVYLDAGCQLNISNANSRKRLSEYLEIATLCHFFAMQTFDGEFGIQDLSEYAWSKKNVINHFGLSPNELSTGQIQAGILFIVPSEQTIKIIELWQKYCTIDNYKYLLDSDTDESNYPAFREHRHDQAIFSAIAKKNKIFTIKDETFWMPNWHIDGQNFPIWAMRTKNGIDAFGPNVFDLYDRAIWFLQNTKHKILKSN